MLVSSQNSYVEILIMMVLESGLFGRLLGDEGGALMEMISALHLF